MGLGEGVGVVPLESRDLSLEGTYCQTSIPGRGGGDAKSFKAVLTWELEVLAILMGGGGGRIKFYPVSRGGGGKKFRTQFFSIL